MPSDRKLRMVGNTEPGACTVSTSARFVVRIDGEPYASFVDRACAEQAVRMWLGEIDGAGLPVPREERARRAWRAIHGRTVEIVER